MSDTSTVKSKAVKPRAGPGPSSLPEPWNDRVAQQLICRALAFREVYAAHGQLELLEQIDKAHESLDLAGLKIAVAEYVDSLKPLIEIRLSCRAGGTKAATEELDLIDLQDPDCYADVFEISGKRYYKVTARLFAWVRSRFVVAQQAAKAGKIPIADFERLKVKFDALRLWAEKNLDRQSVKRSIAEGCEKPEIESVLINN